jgi:FMN-dependent NADH-azoreductase
LKLFGFLGITDIEIVRAEGLAYGDEVQQSHERRSGADQRATVRRRVRLA